MKSHTVRQVSWAPGLLRVEWAGGEVSEFASMWLRDNLPQDRDAHSGQRLVDITDLPAEPRIRSASATPNSIRVQWQNEADSASFDIAWLAANSLHATEQRPELEPRLWLEGASLDPKRDLAWIPVEELLRDAPLRLRWLTQLLQDGIAFVSGLPAQEAALLETVSLLGRACETNYGLVFDVRSVPQPENLAYSDLGLGLHTDNPYREPVPGFQALHALVTSPDGGDSLFADGFALAEYLSDRAPDDFALLTTTPVPFQFRSGEADLFAERPLIQLTCRGNVSAIHYNSRSIAPLRLSARNAERFYRAYRRLAELLRMQRFHLKYRLADGELVVFDNQRTLHGRTSFSSARHPRHLRGCYLTRDSVYSETAVLRRRVQEGLR